MSEDPKSTIVQYLADRWVSWLIELVVLGVVAYFAISETRKTAEETRAMLTRYDAAISAYTAERTEKIDATVVEATQALKEKLGSLSSDDVADLLEKLKEEKD